MMGKLETIQEVADRLAMDQWDGYDGQHDRVAAILEELGWKFKPARESGQPVTSAAGIVEILARTAPPLRHFATKLSTISECMLCRSVGPSGAMNEPDGHGDLCPWRLAREQS